MKPVLVHYAYTKYHINPDKLKTQVDPPIITEIAVKKFSKSVDALYQVV
jgi:hypothetical protein